MTYQRTCLRCGDKKQVTTERQARGILCRACWLDIRDQNATTRPPCEICHSPMAEHPKCWVCSILLGRLHMYQDTGDGRCLECTMTPKQRAGLLEDNVPLQPSSMGGI